MSLPSAKKYISHPYKVISCTDQSENYKITNIESKSPATCWRTSKKCEQASFDIKFDPIKLHHVDIITQFSPQITITAYNKSDLGAVIDETLLLSGVSIFSYKEVIEGLMSTQCKRYDFYDRPFIPNITFTHMSITVSNRDHKEKPMCLGLNSFILFSRTDDPAIKASPALSFLEQKHKEVNEQLLLAVRSNRSQPIASPSKLNTVNISAEKDRRLSLFKYREPTMSDSRDLHINNVSSNNSNRRNTIGIDTIVPGIKRTWDKNNQENMNNLSFYDSINGSEKKIRPNYVNRDDQYRSNLGRPIGGRRPNDSSQGSADDELQRAIRESEMSYKKEKERWEQYDNEETGRTTSKKVTGLRKVNETDETTQDMDDFQRAIQESKEMYMQEIDQPKLGMVSSMDSQEELNGKAYIELLERVAEEEEDEIGEIPEDDKEESEAEGQEEMDLAMDDFLVKEKARNEDEDDDAGTEVLEDSMAKLWSTEDDENEVKNKNHDEMEIEERKGQGGSNPRIKLTFELDSQNSQGKRNRQLWGRPDTNNMISLVEKDFYNKYLHMETKARNEAEKRKGGMNRVEVVTSYENILNDVVFCLAGFEGDEKKSLKDLGISMGARFLDDIYANLTTHLVTNETITKKYKRAKKMKDVIVVSTRWLIECYGQKKRLSEREFIVNLEDVLSN